MLEAERTTRATALRESPHGRAGSRTADSPDDQINVRHEVRPPGVHQPCTAATVGLLIVWNEQHVGEPPIISGPPSRSALAATFLGGLRRGGPVEPVAAAAAVLGAQHHDALEDRRPRPALRSASRSSSVIVLYSSGRHSTRCRTAPSSSTLIAVTARQYADGYPRSSSSRTRVFGAIRRYEATHVREQRNQRVLPHVRTLAAHVGPSDDQHAPRRVEHEVVRHERAIDEVFDHGMPAARFRRAEEHEDLPFTLTTVSPTDDPRAHPNVNANSSRPAGSFSPPYEETLAKLRSRHAQAHPVCFTVPRSRTARSRDALVPAEQSAGAVLGADHADRGRVEHEVRAGPGTERQRDSGEHPQDVSMGEEQPAPPPRAVEGALRSAPAARRSPFGRLAVKIVQPGRILNLVVVKPRSRRSPIRRGRPRSSACTIRRAGPCAARERGLHSTRSDR